MREKGSSQNQGSPDTDIFGAAWFPDDPEYGRRYELPPAPEPTPGQLSFLDGVADGSPPE